MKPIKGAGAVLFLAALTMSQTVGLASEKVSTVDAEELFHSKQLVEDPAQQHKLDTSQTEDVRAITIDRARLHWDAVDKRTALPAAEKEQVVPKAIPVIITAADIDAEKKQKKQETVKEILPGQPTIQPQIPALQPVVREEKTEEVTTSKENVPSVPMKTQEDSVELPPIQPVQTAEKTAKNTQDTVSTAAVLPPRIVELPPIEQISAPVTAPPITSLPSPRGKIVELPPVQPVK